MLSSRFPSAESSWSLLLPFTFWRFFSRCRPTDIPPSPGELYFQCEARFKNEMRRTVRTSWLLLLLFVSLMFWTGVIFTSRSGQLLSKCIKSTTELSVVSHSLAPVRRVTKSLAELGKMDERNAHIVFFNAVPKSGSELVVLLLQWLQGWNNFRHVRLKGGTARSLTRLQQVVLM